jgi:hypothetical protein
MGQSLSERLGQPIVIENRQGAGPATETPQHQVCADVGNSTPALVPVYRSAWVGIRNPSQERTLPATGGLMGCCHSGAPRGGDSGINNHRPGVWIPGSRPSAAPRNDQLCWLVWAGSGHQDRGPLGQDPNQNQPAEAHKPNTHTTVAFACNRSSGVRATLPRLLRGSGAPRPSQHRPDAMAIYCVPFTA